MSKSKTKNAFSATMTLLEEAERAGKIRDALTNFVAPCAKNAIDIETCIAALSNLVLALKEIDSLIKRDAGPEFDDIRPGLEDIHDDIAFALGGAWECIGELGRGMKPEDYRRTWKAITARSKASCGKSLSREIEDSCLALEDLSTTIRGHSKPGKGVSDRNPRSHTTTRSKSQIKINTTEGRGRPTASRAKTDLPLEARMMQNLSINQVSKQKSYERQRNGRPMSPTDSNASSSNDPSMFKGGGFPMSPPLSPVATSSTTSNMSSNAPSIMATTTHWAPKVFKNTTVTKLPTVEEPTRYHEPRQTVTEHEMPDQSYESVFHLSYPGALRLTLFIRPSDGRAKAVCFYTDYRGQHEYSCLPVDRLHVKREGSLLRIYCQRVPGKHERWATLNFSSYERQILFASMILALRSQDGDPSRPNVPITDDEFRDEVSEFAASIQDNPFKHVLRVCYDKLTGSVRLLASVRGGVQDRMPVWTAFISDDLKRSSWCRLVDKHTIMLSRLAAHMFTSTYRLRSTPSGAILLKFEMQDDAEAFLSTIAGLRR